MRSLFLEIDLDFNSNAGMMHPMSIQAIPSYGNGGVYQSACVVQLIGRLQYEYPVILLVLLIFPRQI